MDYIKKIINRHNNRLILGIEKLQAAGYLGALNDSVMKLAEADRCAEIIEQRFLL